MFHACADQRVELLSLRASEQGQSLLADPLCSASCGPLRPAGPPTPLPAQPSGPLHALPPEEGVVRRVGGRGGGLGRGGVAVGTPPGQQGLSGLSGVLVVLHCDGHLGLRERHTHTQLRPISSSSCFYCELLLSELSFYSGC